MKSSKCFLKILGDLIQRQQFLFLSMCKVFHCTISFLPFFSSLHFPKLLGGSSVCKVQFVCVLKSDLYQSSFVFAMYSTNKIIFKQFWATH